MRTGLAPQLTLEAAMLRQGGFKTEAMSIPAGGSVAALAYVALKGGARAGEFMPIDFKEGSPDAQADRALAKLAELVRRFDDDNEPFARWCTRCGRRVTAITITLRASRNGRAPVVPKTISRARHEMPRA